MWKPCHILLLGIAAVAGSSLALGAQASGKAKSPYALALAEAKKDPGRADYGKLRELLTKDSSYLPYVHLTPAYREHHPALFVALESKDFKAAIKHAEAILEVDYLDTEAHYFSSQAYEALGNKKQSEYHRQFFDGVMDSILGSGDGSSPQSAIRVITLTEEWAVLSLLGYPPGGTHATQVHDGVKYDVLTGKHVETGKEASFYFRPVDVFWKQAP